MSEAGDFELFSAPAAKEHDEKSDEKFKEEMKRAQKAHKQLKKEEGKARAKDDKLAKIIIQFLSKQSGGSDLFLLISRCVAQNISSKIIIAVLSLIDRNASEEIVNILEEIKNEMALVTLSHGDLNSLNPSQKLAIDKWIQNINTAVFHKPDRSLESLVLKSVSEDDKVISKISPVLIQLSAFIMRDYLAMEQSHIDVKILYDFMENVYVRMIKNLEEMVQGQKQLSSSENPE